MFKFRYFTLLFNSDVLLGYYICFRFVCFSLILIQMLVLYFVRFIKKILIYVHLILVWLIKYIILNKTKNAMVCYKFRLFILIQMFILYLLDLLNRFHSSVPLVWLIKPIL